MMRDLVTGECVSTGIGHERGIGLCSFFGRSRNTVSNGRRLSSIIGNDRHHSAIRCISEQARRCWPRTALSTSPLSVVAVVDTSFQVPTMLYFLHWALTVGEKTTARSTTEKTKLLLILPPLNVRDVQWLVSSSLYHSASVIAWADRLWLQEAEVETRDCA